MIAIFVVSVLYMALYWWPHSQGRPSVFDRYTPLGRELLAKLGFAPETKQIEGEGQEEASPPVDRTVVRNAIIRRAEWTNSLELDAIETSGRDVTIVVRARMTSSEALKATREIFTIVFEDVSNVDSIRVITRVKARSAAGGGRFVDSVRTDIMMTRATYANLNWPTVTPSGLPKVADRAKLNL